MKRVKPVLFFILLCGLLFTGRSPADASTVWEPVSSKVEFTLAADGGTGTYQFALFDDVQTANDPLYLFVKKTSDSVIFSQLPNSADWQAKNPPDAVTLTGSNRFRIALFDGKDWVADTADWNPENCTYTIIFGADYPELIISNAKTVPAPASALLLGAGIVGLIGFRRVGRKSGAGDAWRGQVK